MNTELQAAKEKLSALRAELNQVNRDLEALEESKKKLETRRRQLCRGWNYNGEILDAELAVRDAGFPIVFPAGAYARATRIVGVTAKTISLREDGREDVRKISRSTGHPPNQKTPYGSKLDVEKALQIWEAWQAQTEVVSC